MNAAVIDLAEHASRARASAGIPDWRGHLDLKQQGKGTPVIEPTRSNFEVVLSHHDAWKGCFRRNRLSNDIEIHRAPPWSDGEGRNRYPRSIDDADISKTIAWFEKQKGNEFYCKPSDHTMLAALNLVANGNSYHPIEDYLRACYLAWDGVERIDRWLTTYCGATDTPLHRAMGARWLAAAVERAHDPGCKMDSALILEGKQGMGKSTTFSILGGKWFSDSKLDYSNTKTAGEVLSGIWILELAELSGLGKSEITDVKAFMTSPSDRYRPAFAKIRVDVPRQCVFGGTTNAEEYLTDPTGARRFWTVRANVTEESRDALRRDRDQLWGEAVARYLSGEPRYLDTADLQDAAAEAVSDRYVEDTWHEHVVQFLEGKHARRLIGENTLTTSEILEHACALKISEFTPGYQSRIAKIMRRLDWEPGRSKDKKRRTWQKVR